MSWPPCANWKLVVEHFAASTLSYRWGHWSPMMRGSALRARRCSSRRRQIFQPLPFDANAARAFGQVAASFRRAGRKPAARAYDAMIAAIAIANDLPLYTCNPSDFAAIDRLRVEPVPHPDPT